MCSNHNHSVYQKIQNKTDTILMNLETKYQLVESPISLSYSSSWF